MQRLQQVKTKSLSNEDLLQEFLVYLKVERYFPHNTIRSYKADLKSFMDFLDEESAFVLDANKKTLRRYVVYLSQFHYKSSSICRKISAIRTFFRFLAEEDYILSSPATVIRSPKRQNRLPKIVNPKDIQTFLSKPNTCTILGIRDRSMFELLYATGLRCSELLDLSLDCVDFDQRELRAFGKGSKERVVIVSKRALKWLDRYLKEARPHLLKKHSQGSSIVFLNKNSKRMSRQVLHRAVKRYAKAAGLPESFTVHTLRHCFATNLLESGCDIRIVQELLGHSSLLTTQVYTHITRKRLKEEYKKFERGDGEKWTKKLRIFER